MHAVQLSRRAGRASQEYAVMLALIIVVTLAMVRLLTPTSSAEPQPLLDQMLDALIAMGRCVGFLVLASVLLASAELLKKTADGYRQRKTQAKLTTLQALLHNASNPAPNALPWVLRQLNDPLEIVRRRALAATYVLLRSHPHFQLTPTQRQDIERTLLSNPGFCCTLAQAPAELDLLAHVTLGAKLGAGSAEKRIAPVTSDPNFLVSWIQQYRQLEANEQQHLEVQISIGYDTGILPSQEERSRFLGLYLYIATTDLQYFQALLPRPPRDPNAAYGLVIRGDLVETRYPGQARGHRLDYVFPLPTRLSPTNLAGLFRQIQLLNLGMLLAYAAETARVLYPEWPFWIDGRRRKIARIYRDFERKLVALLRRFDAYRDPERVHRLHSGDHAIRMEALQTYRLEECLYPQYRWVVPLYDPDTRWDRLLQPLRAIEAMLLHQGDVEGRDATRGADFIHQTRHLGDETARAIEEALAQPATDAVPTTPPLDPFIDPGEEAATRHYLTRMTHALLAGEAHLEDLPAPTTFQQAARYYGIHEKSLAAEMKPEV